MQIKQNPSRDFTRMYRHITKGAWAFSDQDHGWAVSDCTAEALMVHPNEIKSILFLYTSYIYHSSYVVVPTLTIKHAERNCWRES